MDLDKNLNRIYKGQELEFIEQTEALLIKIKSQSLGHEANGREYYILDDEKFDLYFKELSSLMGKREKVWRADLGVLFMALSTTLDWLPIKGYYSQNIINILISYNLGGEREFYNLWTALDLKISFFNAINVKGEESEYLLLKKPNGDVVPLFEQIFNRPDMILKIGDSFRGALMHKIYQNEEFKSYLLSRPIDGLYKAVTDFCYASFNDYKYEWAFKEFMFNFAQSIEPGKRNNLMEAVKSNLGGWLMNLEHSTYTGLKNLAPKFEPSKPSGNDKFSNIVFKNLIFDEREILKFVTQFLDIDKKDIYNTIIHHKKQGALNAGVDNSANEAQHTVGKQSDEILSKTGTPIGTINIKDLEKILASYPNSNHNALVAQEMFDYCWEMGNFSGGAHIAKAVEYINPDFSFKQFEQGLKHLSLRASYDDYFYRHLNTLAKNAEQGLWRGYGEVLDICFYKCVSRRSELDGKFRATQKTKIADIWGKIDEYKLSEIMERYECKTIMPLIVCLLASQGEHLTKILELDGGQYNAEHLNRAYKAIEQIIDTKDYLFIEKNLLEAQIEIKPNSPEQLERLRDGKIWKI